MAKDYTCIIIDDEPDAIELLAARISILYKNIEIAGTYTTWEAAFSTLKLIPVDIVLLDVSMPEKTGIDLLKMLPGLKSEIVFTTAHKEYAIDAFKFAATGYILKPIDDQDLINAIDKCIERVIYKKAIDTETHTVKQVRDKIGIPNVNGIDYVNVSDILYFETVHGYTRVVMKTGEITSSFSIGKFKALLAGHSFYQPHRSYIVNLNRVARYKTTGLLVMEDKKEIPLSKNVKDEFLHLFSLASRKSNDRE